jgi:hypothetical protein
LEAGDDLCPLLKLGILHLNGILKINDNLGVGVHRLTCEVDLLLGVDQPMLDLAKAAVRDLQLKVLLHRLTCPMMKRAFSLSRLSIMCDVRVACSAYVLRCARCSMMTLPVLCYKLNKYLVYLAKCEH